MSITLTLFPHFAVISRPDMSWHVKVLASANLDWYLALAPKTQQGLKNTFLTG